MENKGIGKAMRMTLANIFPELPDYPEFDPAIRRAPKREFTLNERETALALKNALRYIPPEWQEKLAPEFLEELLTRGGSTDTVSGRGNGSTENRSTNTGAGRLRARPCR